MAETSDINQLAEEMASRLRDAAYVAVGLGVLGLQRAQVRRRDAAAIAARRIEHTEHAAQVRDGMRAGARQLGEWLDATTQTVGASLAPLEAQLPAPARLAAAKARTELCARTAQLRQLVSQGE